MSEFRDRLAEAMRAAVRGDPMPDGMDGLADALIESGVVADPADVYDPKGYLWRDQWKWAVERAEKAEARLADAWDEGRESGITDEQQAHRRWTPTRNPYRAEPETTP